jgi:23S rRNA (uracil1939-C5)-methyltransferase
MDEEMMMDGEMNNMDTKGKSKPTSKNNKFNHKPTGNKTINGKEKAKVQHKETAEDLTLGDNIVVTIKRIGINGEGVGYYRRKAVFINGALPGEVVKAKVTRSENKFIEALVQHVEKKSVERIQPPCPVYDQCGGCQIQHLSPKGQALAKEDIVKEAFARYANLPDIKIKPILSMEHPWGYRNKAQLQLGLEKGKVIAGLYAPESHQLIDIAGCPIQHPKLNEAIAATKSILQKLKTPVTKAQAPGANGYVRTVVVRYGFQSNELQLTLVTTNENIPQLDKIVAELRINIVGLTGISMNINAKNTSLVFGPKTVLLWGSQHMEESLGEVKFNLSPRAFFQLNPMQTVSLYETVRAYAGLTGKESVVDAYCGTGTIGLWLAPYAKEIRGIESIPEAVIDAKNNAKNNDMNNVSFYEGYAEELLPRWVKKGYKPDVIIADPPRTGLDSRFIEAVLYTKPEKFIYVSCNPSTLAKDCKVFLDGGYKIESIQPVDMFPQTSQVECCVLLKLAGE